MVCGPSAHTCSRELFVRQPVVPSVAPPRTKAVVLPPLYQPSLSAPMKAMVRQYLPIASSMTPPLSAPTLNGQPPPFSPSSSSSVHSFEIPPISTPFPSILPTTFFPGPEYTSATSFSTPSYPLGPPHPDSSGVNMVRGGRRGLPPLGRNTAFSFPSSMAWNGPVDPHMIASRPLVNPGAYEYAAGKRAFPGTQAYYSRDPSFLPPAGRVYNRGLVASYMYHWNTPQPPVVPRPGKLNYGLF